MSKIPPEVVEKFTSLQEQVWENVGNAAAHLSDPPITFSFQPPEVVPPETARALAGEPGLSIQFAFASSPEHNQFIVIPSAQFAAIAGFLKGEEITDPDESLIPETREFLEGIVQGICLACGIFKNEPMVASGLSIRYQILALPDNFGRNDDLVKTEVICLAKESTATFSWFIDNRTVEYICGSEQDAEGDSPKGQGDSLLANSADGSGGEDVGGLSLLLDVPLEISVELGRVKMLVKDVVDLGTGSIVEIDKAAGEPVDVMVNGRLVARGEVVVIEDNFGVRITEILTAQERLSKLNAAA